MHRTPNALGAHVRNGCGLLVRREAYREDAPKPMKRAPKVLLMSMKAEMGDAMVCCSGRGTGALQ